MSDKSQQYHAHQLEQAIATAFTCRSVIKYTSSLNEEEKNELVADIDTMLKFLRNRSTATAPTVSPQSQTGVRPSNANPNKAVGKVEIADDKTHKQRLSEIYRVVQLYLGTKSGDGTSEFMVGFRAAMAAIDEVQAIAMQSPLVGPGPSTQHMEHLLEKVRASIADVYSIFIEFSRAISNVLQGSGIYIDTEELSSIALERSTGQAKQKQQRVIPDLSPLLKVYETHLQLHEKKGTIPNRIDDATAFLIFLSENLASDLNKRDTVIAQLNKIARLLNDLAYLLSDYESAISALQQRQ